MKVVIVAYGHADNVICLASHLSRYIETTLIFVTAGDRFTRSILDWDITELPFGLTFDTHTIKKYIGDQISHYISPQLKILIARTPTRSIVRDWRRKNLKCIREAAEYINRNAYDVVHFNGFSSFQLYFHFFLRKMRKVYTIHDYLPHSGEWNTASFILNNIYARLDYQFIQHYHFLAVNFSDFFKVPPQRVHTVYCGPLDVYKKFVNGEVNEEPATILFFGRISRYKGLDYLVPAFSEVKKIIPNAKLIIAGNGDSGFKSGNDGSYEVYNRHISNAELVHLIQRATIIVTPYTDATHSAVIMTAYAFGKPVVASSVGGIPEVVANGVTGTLVPARNPQVLAEAIIDLLLHREKRVRMKKNIEKECLEGKLSWDNVAKRTIEVYQTAIERCRV